MACEYLFRVYIMYFFNFNAAIWPYLIFVWITGEDDVRVTELSFRLNRRVAVALSPELIENVIVSYFIPK